LILLQNARLSEEPLWQSGLPDHRGQRFRANFVARGMVSNGYELNLTIYCTFIPAMAPCRALLLEPVCFKDSYKVPEVHTLQASVYPCLSSSSLPLDRSAA
jgi:hypothetical protein